MKNIKNQIILLILISFDAAMMANEIIRFSSGDYIEIPEWLQGDVPENDDVKTKFKSFVCDLNILKKIRKICAAHSSVKGTGLDYFVYKNNLQKAYYLYKNYLFNLNSDIEDFFANLHVAIVENISESKIKNATDQMYEFEKNLDDNNVHSKDKSYFDAFIFDSLMYDAYFLKQ